MIITLLKITLFGIIEGITEWLPVSSTGHLIILDKWFNLGFNIEFKEFFLVFIQLGAVMAVFTSYFKNLIPFYINNKININKTKIKLWLKIIIACLPVAVVGILFDDIINKKFYNIKTVSISLIVVGIIFLFSDIFSRRKLKNEITIKSAFIIGFFQIFSAVFPGVSRSGSTILGATILGYEKDTSTKFSFYLAIPVMFGASILKLYKLVESGIVISFQEIFILIYSALIAYIISLFAIKILTNFVKKNSFKIFGFYRIILGFLILLFF